MNFFQSLWEKLLDKYRNYSSAQKERIKRLQELELENEQHKGHIQNPLSLVSRNREISRLKHEIKNYRHKCLSVCGVVALLLFLLLCFSISAVGARRDERNHIRELMVSSMATSNSSSTTTPLPAVTPSATPIPTPIITPSPTPSPSVSPTPTPSTTPISTPTITPTPVPTATATPTIAPQPIEAESSIASSSGTDSPQTVTSSTNYVYISENGKKYHRRPGCSNMENPMEVTVEQAIAWGYTPCKKCY